MINHILGVIPLWLFGLLLAALCTLVCELGRLVRRRLGSRSPATAEPGGQGYVVGAIFGLLAFLISFTFSIAVDRFDARRDWMAQETNAIQTTFLRAYFFDEPVRSQLQSTIRQYAHSRIAPEDIWDLRIEPQLAYSHRLQDQLWLETRIAVYPVRETDLASYFLATMNEMLDVGTRRELAGMANIPGRILNSLLIYLLVSCFVLGFVATSEAALMRTPSALMFLLFAIAIVMILDLDNPRAGAIKVSQTVLTNLVAALDRVELPPPTRPGQPN
jgi:hypothetical protein